MNAEVAYGKFEQLATLVAALGAVARLARALRRSEGVPGYIGEAIEGQTAVALEQVLAWTESVPGGAARHLSARIRASLGHGDRAVLGSLHAGQVVASGRRLLE